jgi:ABC-type transport system substrate-binding protein
MTTTRPLKIDKVVFIHISEDSVCLRCIRGRGPGLGECEKPEMLKQFQNNLKWGVQTVVGLNLNYIVMNNSVKPFNDLKVRQAVNHAVNKQALSIPCSKGLGLI